MPRDSVTAQTSSWFCNAIVEALVLGRAVEGRPALLRPVRGREVVVALLTCEMNGYDPVANAYEVDPKRLGGAIEALQQRATLSDEKEMTIDD